jgi:glycerophosphoryl diester phosphodiesterase
VKEVVRILKKHKLDSADAKVFLQCFELSTLQDVRKEISVKTVFLLSDPKEIPADLVLKNVNKTYGDYVKSKDELVKLAKDVNGIGPHKNYLLPINLATGARVPTPVLDWAHAAGLLVHPYTFRGDLEFLAKDFGGDPLMEYLAFYKLGVDGLFSDFPDQAVAARKKLFP